ncbi:hypothetical protein GCM10011380_06540 [Sphingomonas metalli]|uniref:DUF4167 domain-containing protein n=1 Tax=Sphingomonas metalli TaxID=1779358 RepID=A0A916SVJ1_9SPHN|nr:DUF4167 domain-containing protein [Sphingomonas metalli]GGB19671.1 hypothetical protein GCM10011380_06540 [Sphingomonas metalli]
MNNRQAGRRRGRGGGNGGGNGQRPGGQGRADSGNRIDSRARGNANQLYEKYKNMAADAQRQGDRVNTEYYLQFADHYFRVLSDQRGRFEDQAPRRSNFDADGESDDEFGDEGEPIRAGEQGEGNRAERVQRDYAERAPRDYAERTPREQQREGGQRDFAHRESGQREGGQREGGQREAQPRGERSRRWEERPNRRVDAAAEAQADLPIVEAPVAASPEPAASVEATEAAPRRRGRPRREPVAAPEANGFEADRLPPSLGIAAANDADTGAAADEGEAPKPRRRRVRTAVAADVVAE